MKYVVLAALAMSFAGAAHAQVGYVEGTIGATSIATVETKTFSVTEPGLNFTGRGELDFENGLTVGLEMGVGGFYNNTVRFGVSWDYLKAEQDGGRLVGTLNGAPGQARFTAAEARELGFTDNDTHIIEGQAYFNLPQIAGRIRPYLGVGAGFATIENAKDPELAMSATAGFRYQIDPKVYAGLRARYHYINGITDELELDYEPITATTVSFMFGTYF